MPLGGQKGIPFHCQNTFNLICWNLLGEENFMNRAFQSDCNHIFKWVSTDRFGGPDHRLYLQLFDLTPLTQVILIQKI